MLHVRSASLSEILMKLERNGYISRSRSEQDKRNFVITVTEEGAAAAGEYKNEFLKKVRGIFSPLTDTERQQLGEILGKIIMPLEENGQDDERCHGRRRGHGPFGPGRCRRHHHRRHGGLGNQGFRAEE